MPHKTQIKTYNYSVDNTIFVNIEIGMYRGLGV